MNSELLDKIKLWVIAIIIIASVYILTYAELGAAARYSAVAAGAVVAGLLFYFSQVRRDFFAFSRESLIELRKVVWPGKQETAQLSAVVLVFLAIMVALLSLFDLAINAIIGQLLE